MSATIIHRLNLLDYTEGDENQKNIFAQEIGKAFNDSGFVTISNHGLSRELIENLYIEVKNLFALPEDIKKQYEIYALAGQRGYTSKGREKAKGALTPDLKEFWQIGQFIANNASNKPIYPENIVVAELPHFNAVTKEVYQKLEIAGIHILKAIARFLKIEESYFDSNVHEGNSILRAIHYFPIDDPNSLSPDAVRAGAHEDINLITLLIGASADGLELLTRDGIWFPVKAEANDIVVNVGDMLQRLTNNKLRSTTHRVVNPIPELMKTSRYSVPFFLHPKAEMNLACLPSCVDAENPKAYDDYTAGEYLDERLREIGLKM